MKIVRFDHSQYNGLGVVDGDDLVIVSDTDGSLPRNTVELIERWGVLEAVSYTHLTLPTTVIV